MHQDFQEVIESRQRLRELQKLPSHLVSNKVIDHVDGICERFIAASPFVIVSSRGSDGHLEMSPRGDPPGFVAVLDRKTLAIPDRPGNNRMDTIENLIVHPEIGLLFLIPGHGDTLRVSGTARVVRDSALQERLAVDGRKPGFILVVTVEEAFTHCPKCIIRSRMWQPERWPDRSNVPSLAEAMIAHGRLSETTAEVQAAIDHSNTQRLY